MSKLGACVDGTLSKCLRNKIVKFAEKQSGNRNAINFLDAHNRIKSHEVSN